MDLHLTKSQYRRLLDLVYLGNFVINDIRDNDRIEEYDEIESLVFSHCEEEGMPSLIRKEFGQVLPSIEYEDGGILEVIRLYEDTLFYEILAQELSMRELDFGYPKTKEQLDIFQNKMQEYLDEFQKNGMDHVNIDIVE